ncbi:putative serine incorporator/TMS membrane protein [Lupinus albus]|uniref:Putative serine incorporator/TMS membrane protein n=1 Tax=Lupinus albus TaxID=3870 RepID=A0A6A4PFQ5_LUPAL|nr:putative serine incorporator/TMS membrane protein [Lupinus albus]
MQHFLQAQIPNAYRKDYTPPAEDDVPYGYGFFHLVFATGAMYFAMLLIGWNSHHSMRKWAMDVGWTSTWVKIVNEWLGVSLYCKYSFLFLSFVFCIIFFLARLGLAMKIGNVSKQNEN